MKLEEAYLIVEAYEKVENQEGMSARVAEAEGEVAKFNSMFEEYSKYPLITKQRLFYEAIEDVLPGSKLIITDGQTQEILPLDSFNQSIAETAPVLNNAGDTETTEQNTDGE